MYHGFVLSVCWSLLDSALQHDFGTSELWACAYSINKNNNGNSDTAVFIDFEKKLCSINIEKHVDFNCIKSFASGKPPKVGANWSYVSLNWVTLTTILVFDMTSNGQYFDCHGVRAKDSYTQLLWAAEYRYYFGSSSRQFSMHFIWMLCKTLLWFSMRKKNGLRSSAVWDTEAYIGCAMIVPNLKPRCKKYAVGFWKSRFILGQKSVFNHSYRCQEGNKKLLVYLTCTNKW